MNPGKHQSSKQRGQDLGWKVHDRAHPLFFTHEKSKIHHERVGELLKSKI